MEERAGQAFADFVKTPPAPLFRRFRAAMRGTVQWCVGCVTLVMKSFFLLR